MMAENLKEKIANLIEAYALQRIDGGKVSLGKIYVDQILALLPSLEGIEVEEDCQFCVIGTPTKISPWFIDFYFKPDTEKDTKFSFPLKSGGRIVRK